MCNNVNVIDNNNSGVLLLSVVSNNIMFNVCNNVNVIDNNNNSGVPFLLLLLFIILI